MSDAPWYVYIVRASDQTLYTGITTDLKRRLAEHQSGKRGPNIFVAAQRLRWCSQSPAPAEAALASAKQRSRSSLVRKS